VTVRQQRAPGLRDIGFAVDHVDGRSFRTLRSSHVSKLSSASALKVQGRNAPCDRGRLAREKLAAFATKTTKMLCVMHGSMMRRFGRQVNIRGRACSVVRGKTAPLF
jgi:hypothetical protein